jgi:hypothetical protein
LQKLTERVAWAIKIIATDDDLDKGVTDVVLAKILGTNKDTLAVYRREGGLLKGGVINGLVACYHFSPQWLFNGEGEPFPGARARYPAVCGPETIPPVTDTATSVHNKDNLPPVAAGDAQKINIEEAMGKTYAVLTSGTAYSVALYLNIQQFKSAVDASREIAACQDRITTLETQVDDLRREVNRLIAPPTIADPPAAFSAKEAM